LQLPPNFIDEFALIAPNAESLLVGGEDEIEYTAKRGGRDIAGVRPAGVMPATQSSGYLFVQGRLQSGIDPQPFGGAVLSRTQSIDTGMPILETNFVSARALVRTCPGGFETVYTYLTNFRAQESLGSMAFRAAAGPREINVEIPGLGALEVEAQSACVDDSDFTTMNAIWGGE
jgi:hypothetical protein